MFSKEQYSLIDFGDGRRLERFGELLLDRLCPSAVGTAPRDRETWKLADARFEEKKSHRSPDNNDSNALGVRGRWRPLTDKGKRFFSVENIATSSQQPDDRSSSQPWKMQFANNFTFELKGSPFGHVGVFPEQAENWDRIIEFCLKAKSILNRPARLLNLFGYTGGSALAAASAGAQITHLDAARNVVLQAKRNAAISFGENAAIRWIVDDAVKFVKREINRQSFYDGIILDPPTYGHGAKGEVWRLSRNLQPLLNNIVNILDPQYSFIMLSAHTPGFDPQVLTTMLKSAINQRFDNNNLETRYLSKVLEIRSESSNSLYSGDLAIVYVRTK